MSPTANATAGMAVGQRIRWARGQKGISQERLATALGTTRQVVIRWEKGMHRPNDESRRRLGVALGHAPAFFADEDDEEDAPVAAAGVQDMLRVLHDLLGRAINCDDRDEICA